MTSLSPEVFVLDSNLSLGEIILRATAALMFTIASVMVGYFLAGGHGGKTRPLYWYLEWVIVATATWRWIVFILGLMDQAEVRQIDWFIAYVNPINQSLLCLLGFALVLHGWMNLKRASR